MEQALAATSSRIWLEHLYVNTLEIIADFFFTKWLEPKKFREMRDVIMNVQPHAG